MSNMSYCRFRNTLSDLEDCYYNMDSDENMSDEEKKARKKMIQLCSDIANDFIEELDES